MASLCALALAVGGCGNGEGAASQTSSSRVEDDPLVVILPRDAEQLDPRFVGDPYGLKITRLLFGSLVSIDPRSLEVVPDLAERIEIETPTRYRAVLRPGLAFSDGSTLDADDVIATYESVVDPDLGSRYASSYARIVRMHRVDDLTVVFELDAPHATFVTDLELPILRAEDAHHQVGGPDGPAPVGAGPYVLSHRAPGVLELAPNPRWYGGAPHFPHLRFLVIRDDNTRALRLLAGAGDLAVSAVPPLLVPLFEESEAFEVESAPGIGVTYLGFNTEAPIFSDVRVRRALAHAIDRDALVEAKLDGRARLARSFIPPGHWAYDDEVPTYHLDPARARALLDEAGFVNPDGEGGEPRFRMTLRTSTDRLRLSISRAIAAMLRDVGVEAEVRPSETATLIADLNRGRFEATFLAIPEVFEPHVLSWFFSGDRIPGPGREGANRWRLRDAALDAAFERGRETTNRTARLAAYREVQRILAAELPAIPLWHEDVTAIVGVRAAGYEVPRDGRFQTLAR